MANQPKAEQPINAIKITYDWWDAAGERHKAGAVVNMTLAEAKATLEAGKGLRADPLPGEA